ncbi:metal-dependent hydrolase family protein [Sphingobium chlorophenolicum]|uniref:Amidohydrolase n=1 Tax=Sphingobium chlorophenolicum TaxID=46429 RepID=A0A081RGQ8_SPHCR|nr:amidohydrolase family protein [Sphingobium chlorophenolicum]KEQ54381.1 Amidohydrolase [Sphingobium chlorophenolicum]
MATGERIMFRGGKVWDGRADSAVEADLLVEDGVVRAVDRGGLSAVGEALEIDASGGTMIPGMIEAHGHLSFPVVTYAYHIEDTPPEETVLITMHNAKRLIDAGFTGVIGAGSPRIRSEIVIRNEIDAGLIAGPRLMASTPTLTATGGLNDSGQLHQQRLVAALVCDGPDEIRRAVRLCYREGVDVVKLNISGDDFFPRPDGRVTTMAEDEVAMACAMARELGLLVAAHARSAESVKRAVRCGVTIIHHADFCDEEALDMLEGAKDRIFVTPSIGYYHGLIHYSGMSDEMLAGMKVREGMDANIATHKALHERGVRMLIGGDYGLPFMPNGLNAQDVAHLVDYIGLTPVEALRAATWHGGLAMGKGTGLLVEGAPADLLLCNGDPTQDAAIVADAAKLRVIMKGGRLHKAPDGLRAAVAGAA